MKRKNFLASLLGIAALPKIAKAVAERKPKWERPDPETLDEYQLMIMYPEYFEDGTGEYGLHDYGFTLESGLKIRVPYMGHTNPCTATKMRLRDAERRIRIKGSV